MYSVVQMTYYASFTARAHRDCRRIANGADPRARCVDEDLARDVIDNPDLQQERPDPGDPQTVYVYSVRRLFDDLALVVTWHQMADRRLVDRVSLLHPDELD